MTKWIVIGAITAVIMGLSLVFSFMSQHEQTQSPTKDAQLWANLKDTTWRRDSGFAGEGYVFYEDDGNVRRCIHQVYGSGVASVSSEYAPIKILDAGHIDIGGTPFTYHEGQMVSASTTLTLYADTPIVYNKTKPVDMKTVRSTDFEIHTLDQAGQ